MYDEDEFEEIETEELPISCVDARIDSAKYSNFKYKLKQYEYLKEDQIRDLYSIYYKEEYEFNLNEDNSNFWWFKLLNKFNKQNIKVATKRNSFMCEELLPIFCDSLNYILKEKEEELKEQEKQQQEGEGENEQENENNFGQGTSQLNQEEGNQQNNEQSPSNQKPNEEEESNSPNQEQSNSLQQNTSPSNGASKSKAPKSKEEELEKFIDKEVKKALKKIANKTEDIAESYPEAFEETDDDEDGEKVNKQVVQKLLSKVKFDKSAINQFVKSTIKRVQNHFGSIVKLKEESIFETDEFDDLDCLEFLQLPEIFWEEVVNRTKEKSVVVDVFIDESGSMQSKRNIFEAYNSFTHKGMSRQVEMFTLAKILCHYLNADKYMNDLYMFDTSVRQITDFEEMYTRSANGGGTSIDNCIRKIHLTNNPTIIITDANDNITEYSELAYILNIDYNMAQDMYDKAKWNKTIQRYIDNNQILCFLDGQWKNKAQLELYIKESYENK